MSVTCQATAGSRIFGEDSSMIVVLFVEHGDTVVHPGLARCSSGDPRLLLSRSASSDRLASRSQPLYDTSRRRMTQW
jgi:hypothetical protein